MPLAPLPFSCIIFTFTVVSAAALVGRHLRFCSDRGVQHPNGVANRLALEKTGGLTDARLDVAPP